MYHELKIFPAHFKAVVNGDKRFEIRHNGDRGFQKGDIVSLEEFVPGAGPAGTFTGHSAHVKITYVTNYNQPENQVVFGFELVEIFEGKTVKKRLLEEAAKITF